LQRITLGTRDALHLFIGREIGKMKKVTEVMDKEFQAAHRLAFQSDYKELKPGDTVFIIDHYWPGIVTTIVHHNPSQLVIMSVGLLLHIDGPMYLTYSPKQLRPCSDWDVPTADEVLQMYNAVVAQG
jgi:hypothetical protein